jgi:hypothetical protein
MAVFGLTVGPKNCEFKWQLRLGALLWVLQIAALYLESFVDFYPYLAVRRDPKSLFLLQ